MLSKTTATAVDIQKALGLKGTLEDITANGTVRVIVQIQKADFLKALKLSGELQSIEVAYADDAVVEATVTSVGDVSAPAKRGRKPKNPTP